MIVSRYRNWIVRTEAQLAASILLCLLIAGICLGQPDPAQGAVSQTGFIYCGNDEFSTYGTVLTQLLPAYTIIQADARPFEHLARGTAVEAFDFQALPALEAGVAKYWYPQFLATVVIAVDRSRTDARIDSWGDLPSVGQAVGFSSSSIYSEPLMGAIAYGLEGEGFTLGSTAALLARLGDMGQFVEKSFATPIVICFDYQAAEMLRQGLPVEIIVPAEGTLSYEKGLLSNTELEFAQDSQASLLSAGLRLLDGSARAELYPESTAYERAAPVKDYGHFTAVCQDTLRTLRRDVLRIRLYSTKDARQHQLFALAFMAFIIVWASSVLYRSLRKEICRAMFLTAILLLCWSSLRLIKYQVIATSILGKYLWYSYYLFLLSLPLVLLWLAYVIDKPDIKVSPPLWFRLMLAVSSLTFLLVFTNDLHFLAFRFDPGSPNWPSEYGYGPVYYLSLACSFVPLLGGLGLLLVRSRGYVRKKSLVFPLTFVLLLAAYCYAYAKRISIAYYTDMTMVVGLFAFLFYELLIRIGLVPVNSRYTAFFDHSPLGIRITDSTGAVVLQSDAAANYAYDGAAFASALASSPAPIHADDETLLFAAPITGGHVLWYEGISDLLRLHREMEESVRNLEVANIVLAEEEEIRRAIDAENVRTQLMTQLETEITSHTIRLSTMIEQLGMAMDKTKATARIMLLLCYLKRRSNLFFREREATVLPQNEWMMYFDELAEIAAYSQVQVTIGDGLAGSISVRFATLLYDFFYNVIYWATWLDGIRIIVSLSSEGGRIVLRLLPSEDAHSFRMERGLEAAIKAVGGVYEVKDLDDEAVGLTLSFPQGGESDV